MSSFIINFEATDVSSAIVGCQAKIDLSTWHLECKFIIPTMIMKTTMIKWYDLMQFTYTFQLSSMRVTNNVNICIIPPFKCPLSSFNSPRRELKSPLTYAVYPF